MSLERDPVGKSYASQNCPRNVLNFSTTTWHVRVFTDLVEPSLCRYPNLRMVHRATRG